MKKVFSQGFWSLHINCSLFSISVFTNQAYPHPILWSYSEASSCRGAFLVLILLPSSPTPSTWPHSLFTASVINRCSPLLLLFMYRSLSPPKYTYLLLEDRAVFISVSVCQHLAHCLAHSRNSIHLCWMNVWITLWLGI